jgi:hypothetical protein
MARRRRGKADEHGLNPLQSVFPRLLRAILRFNIFHTEIKNGMMLSFLY